ncbi:hypothetical protein, partial [Sulfuriferula sp.]|uniref:hypothetical protein n=1 Tax=Sulfuriferula sp. TaxID=2025307 RepID=UPI002730E1E1
HSRFIKPGSIANLQIKIQIVDTHESLEILINIGFADSMAQFNRTLLINEWSELSVLLLRRDSWTHLWKPL